MSAELAQGPPNIRNAGLNGEVQAGAGGAEENRGYYNYRCPGDPVVPVTYHAKVIAFPADAGKDAKQVRYIPLSEALSASFAHDAHTAGYSSPGTPYRLKREALSLPGVAVTMVTLQVDLDASHAHIAEGGDPKLCKQRPEEWAQLLPGHLEKIGAKVKALIAKYGGAAHVGRGGWHYFALIAIPISNGEDEERFTRFAKASYQRMHQEFGLVPDPAMAQWNQLFRLPNVRRDGVDYVREIVGKVAPWPFQPTEEDAAEADQYDAWFSECVKRKERRPRRTGARGSGHAPYRPRDRDAKDPIFELAERFALVGGAVDVNAGKYVALCPNRGEHSNDTDMSSATVVWRGGGFHCSHSHCDEIGRADFDRMVRAKEGRAVQLAEVENAVHDAISGSSDRRIVVQVPTGSGKSRAIRTFAARVAQVGGGFTHLSNTHALATQNRSELIKLGVNPAHMAGPGRDLEGREPCARPDIMRPIVDAEIPSSIACGMCPMRKTCPTRKRFGGAQGAVGVHQHVHRISEKSPLIFDEEPAYTDARVLDLETALAGLDAGDRDFAMRVRPWLYDLLDREPKGLRAAFEWANTKYSKAEKRRIPVADDKKIAWTDDPSECARRIADTAKPWPNRRDPILAKRHGGWPRLVKILMNVRFSARRDVKPAKRGDLLIARGLSDAFRVFKERGGVIATATPMRSILATLDDVKIVTMHVPDPVEITRVVVDVSDAQTGKLREDPKRIERWVADALRRARGATLIVCAKEFVQDVRARVKGRDVDVQHFGGVHGLDNWMGCDSFVTLGDHFPSKVEYEEEAAYFGIDPSTLALERVAADLAQAHGRARDPVRTRPALHVHYGRVWPAGWTTEQVVIETLPEGRPSATGGISPAELRERVNAIGSQWKAAQQWEITPRTLSRYLSGEIAIPSGARPWGS